jgi:hypothetical protein
MRVYQGALIALVLSISALAVAQNYHIADRWKIGGQGGSDYLVSDDGPPALHYPQLTCPRLLIPRQVN